MHEYERIIERLKERLLLPLPGLPAQERMAGRVRPMPLIVPAEARLSAVLCLLFPAGGELNILLMQRMADSTAHSGQVSFPGGRFEQEDGNLEFTALREAHEEVGIRREEVEVLGALSSLYIPVSNFNVFPFLGYARQRPLYQLSATEVSHVLEIPLNTLFHHSRKTLSDVVSPVSPEIIRKVNAYQLEDGTIIWGATAMILSEIEALLE